ncbi:MAG TPA: hypothetical protein VN805_11645 [Caulobacteraceae bacterium]|nr:hypothetical protein [Caulobacteraceae bacterium]
MPWGEHQETEVALGADGLDVGIPASSAVDEQAGEPVVRLVLVQRNPDRLAHLRCAPIGADQQPAVGFAPLAADLVDHARSVSCPNL